MSTQSSVLRNLVAVALVGAITLTASAAIVVDGGQVNISGATLFRDFFFFPTSTNDYIDVNGDGCSGFNLLDPNCPIVDQLAPEFTWPNWNGWWLVQYRGVGSVNGLGEFIDYHLQGLTPDSPPNDDGIINHVVFASGGSSTGAFPADPACGSLSPVCQDSVDLAVLDVPVKWAVIAGSAGSAAWDKNPTEDGYGQCPTESSTGFVSNLQSLDRPDPNDPNSIVSLNTNTASPDAHTVFDTQIAWAPICIIANRGTGLEDVKATELQYHFLTGRLPSGENLSAATRDVGSGTRNGAMNSLGIDPSWGRGDNVGSISESSAEELLGPNFRPTNKGGSSRMEGVVQNHRLAMGYTGAAGGSRAIKDALGGKYEIVNVMFDDRGGSQYVRISVDNVLDNADPSTGFQIGGPETFASLGNPGETNPGSATYMANQHAADYLNNITGSIAGFVGNPTLDENFNMPGEYLAIQFFLLDGVDALPDPVDPSSFVANANLNQSLQNFIRANNDFGAGAAVPAWGSINTANKVPTRTASPAWPDPNDPNSTIVLPYNDGSLNGDYYNYFTDDPNDENGGSIQHGTDLNARNALAGDFDGDGDRDIDDIVGLVAAVQDPKAYALAHSTSGDPLSPQIIGDYNGDGNFDAEDVRYHADGLAITVGGALDRDAAFTLVDTTYGGNYFGTTIAGGAAYVAGDSRFDVAGGSPVAGADPRGADGVVDQADYDYVAANFGVWSNIDDAVAIDLSCDMNGDMVVDNADLALVGAKIGIGCTGDLDHDGDVDLADLAALLAAYQGSGAPSPAGDLDNDGDTDLQDLAALLANYGNC